MADADGRAKVLHTITEADGRSFKFNQNYLNKHGDSFHRPPAQFIEHIVQNGSYNSNKDFHNYRIPGSANASQNKSLINGPSYTPAKPVQGHYELGIRNGEIVHYQFRPGSGGTGSGGGPAWGGSGGVSSLLRAGGKALGRGLMVGGLLVSATSIASASEADRSRVIAGEVGGFLGGMATGAALGTAGCPIVGTVIGGIVGGIVGSFLGEGVHDACSNSGPGGIKFATELDVSEVDILGHLLGIVVDSDNGVLSLLTKASNGTDQGMLGVSISDLAFALLVLRNEKEPSFSLDPSDPGNPSGPTLRQVYMPDMLRSTNFGDIMFEADWKLKLLAFGSLSLPNLRSEADITFAQPVASTERRYSRLWIENEKVELAKSDAGILIFKDVKMKVLAKRQVPDPSCPSGLRDVDEHDLNSPERIFAEEFTQRYDHVATKFPCFHRLKEIAKALTLARFILRETNLDLEWALIEQVASGCFTTFSSDIIPIHTQTHSRSNRTLTLTGGVDLKITSVVDASDRKVGQSTYIHRLIHSSSNGKSSFEVALSAFYKDDSAASTRVRVTNLPFCQPTYLANAERLIRAGHSAEALAVIQQGEARKKPHASEYFRARYLAAWSHLKLNQLNELRDCIDQAELALQYQEPQGENYRMLADLTKELKIRSRAAYDRATSYLKNAAGIVVKSAKQNYLLLALSELSSSLLLYPNDTRTILKRCEVHLDLGMHQEALVDATAALLRDPYDGQAAFLLGQSYCSLGSYYDAIDAFAMAEQLFAQGQQKARAKDACETAYRDLDRKVKQELEKTQQYLLHNLAFSVPETWKTYEGPNMKTFRSADSVMSPSVIVQARPAVIPPGTPLMSFVESELSSGLIKILPHYKLLSMQDIQVGDQGLPAVETRFRFTIEGHIMDVRTVWLLLESELYTVSFTLDRHFVDAGWELWTALTNSLLLDSVL